MAAEDKSNLCGTSCSFGSIPCDEDHAIILACNSFVCSIVARIFAKQSAAGALPQEFHFANARTATALLFAKALAKFLWRKAFAFPARRRSRSEPMRKLAISSSCRNFARRVSREIYLRTTCSEKFLFVQL